MFLFINPQFNPKYRKFAKFMFYLLLLMMLVVVVEAIVANMVDLLAYVRAI